MSSTDPKDGLTDETVCEFQRDVWDAAVAISGGLASKVRHIEGPDGKMHFHEDDVLECASLAHTMATRLMLHHFEWLSEGGNLNHPRPAAG